MVWQTGLMKMKISDNQNEIFDVVDENDKVIGQARRGEAHRNKKLIHRSVGVLVFNKKGELFLQQRSATKDTDPLKWTISASGHVSHNGIGPVESAEVGLTFLRTSQTPPMQHRGQTGGSAQKASLPADSSSSITNKNLSLDKVFIEIGGVPGTALVIPLGVKMDQGGYIEVNERLATNVHGIFAAGDLVSYGLSIEQISSAVGLGARAAASAFTFIKQEKAPTVWGGSRIKR